MSSESNNNIENGNKIVKYIQEHAAGLTLLATVSITVGSVLLKYIYYLIELGYTKYFNISASYIDIADDNILYGIVANGVMSLFFALISSLPYLIWQGKDRKWSKVIKIVLITLIPEILLIISLIILATQGIIYSTGQYISTLFAGVILGVIVFSLGFFLLIDKRVSRKEKSKEESTNKTSFEKAKRIIVAFLVLIILESVVIYGSGYFKAASQSEFKIIEFTYETSYVILYETDSNYIVAECEIIGNKINIDKTEHKQISKENIEYSVRQLTQIME
jgi:hypothetical protein